MVSAKVKGRPRVFVYGSLKRSNALNIILRKADAEFVSFDRIEIDGYMVDMGMFPAIVKKGDVTTIFGEVWLIDEEALAAIDYAEGHPKFFTREKIVTKETELRCWVYTLTEEAAEYVSEDDRLDSGVWRPSASEEEFWTKRGYKIKPDAAA